VSVNIVRHHANAPNYTASSGWVSHAFLISCRVDGLLA